jgi:hypothetical protein
MLNMPVIETFNIGDEVQLVPNATFIKGRKIPAEYFGMKFVVRKNENDTYELGQSLKGYPIGVVEKEFVMPYSEAPVMEEDFNPYFISIIADAANVYNIPADNGKIISSLPKFAFYHIIGEKNGFAKLESKPGWVNLADAKVIK